MKNTKKKNKDQNTELKKYSNFEIYIYIEKKEMPVFTALINLNFLWLQMLKSWMKAIQQEGGKKGTALPLLLFFLAADRTSLLPLR